jgi:hypothetical protein
MKKMKIIHSSPFFLQLFYCIFLQYFLSYIFIDKLKKYIINKKYITKFI